MVQTFLLKKNTTLPNLKVFVTRQRASLRGYLHEACGSSARDRSLQEGVGDDCELTYRRSIERNRRSSSKSLAQNADRRAHLPKVETNAANGPKFAFRL